MFERARGTLADRLIAALVAGQAEPIVASRTEQSILEDMGATDGSFQLEGLRQATRELLEAFHEFSPVLRRALHNEHHFDLEKWEERLATLLRPSEHPDAAEQDDLFDRKDHNG